MVLQPLAENAIVHGIAPVPGPGELSLSARRRGNDLVLEVSDSGPGFASGSRVGEPAGASGSNGRASPGIGLANTHARLAQLYGDRASLSASAGPSGGACVLVTIPFRAAPSATIRSLTGSAVE